jgi:hypothetical protein
MSSEKPLLAFMTVTITSNNKTAGAFCPRPSGLIPNLAHAPLRFRGLDGTEHTYRWKTTHGGSI